MLLLTEADVRVLLPMQDLIDSMQSALAAYSNGQVQQPLRTVLQVGAGHAFFGVMPAFIQQSRRARDEAGHRVRRQRGARPAVAPCDDRAAGPADRELHAHHGRALHHRGEDRRGVGGVGEAPCARGCATLAVLGSGVQARSHIEASARVRPLEEVRVWGPTRRTPSALRRRRARRSRAQP